MNNCGTCKHWQEIDHEGVGECQGVPKGEDMWDYDDDGKLITPSPWIAKTVDGSGYFSALRTKADFGCVLWEAKLTAIERAAT